MFPCLANLAVTLIKINYSKKKKKERLKKKNPKQNCPKSSLASELVHYFRSRQNDKILFVTQLCDLYPPKRCSQVCAENDQRELNHNPSASQVQESLLSWIVCWTLYEQHNELVHVTLAHLLRGRHSTPLSGDAQ